MRAPSEPRQFIKSLDGGAVWIYGELETPPTGVQGPLVIPNGWMLEVVRLNKSARTVGLFLAAFGIVSFDIPEFAAVGTAEFVGLSMQGSPPWPWLQTSMMFDMRNAPLPKSREELLKLFETPLHGTSIDIALEASALSSRARQCICATYRESIPIADIARGLGVSHAHLTRRFKRDFGFTPVDYRHRLRVTDAMGRLFKGDDIVDVGQDVGFSDTSRFYQDFRKITGTSPGKCRL